MEHLRKPLTDMTMKLFLAARELKRNPNGDDENIIICPFTVTAIAAMFYCASPPGENRQLENVLRVMEMFNGRGDAKQMLLAFREAFLTLTKHAKTDKGVEEDEQDAKHSVIQHFRLIFANRLFLQRGAEVNVEFLEQIKRNLLIEAEYIDMSGDPTKGQSEIETWLRDKIKSHHPMGVPSQLIDSAYRGPRMVIANAAHFRSGWATPFDKSLTTWETFTLANGKTKQVEMMHITEKFPYVEDNGVKMLELPYHGNVATLVLTLPSKKAGFDPLFQAKNADAMVQLHMQRRMRMTTLSLPKFLVESQYAIKPLLQMVGIKDVFNDNAKMANLTADTKFRASEGAHKAAIQVDEDGTFATDKAYVPTDNKPPPASPGQGCARKESVASNNPQVVDFTADRPFLIAVRHNRSSVFVFSGCITNP